MQNRLGCQPWMGNVLTATILVADADADPLTAKSGQAEGESPMAESPFFRASKSWRRFQDASADEDPWHGPGQR